MILLKSDLRGIETTAEPGVKVKVALKSDLRGIETRNAGKGLGTCEQKLKSDLRGIETMDADPLYVSSEELKSDLRGIETTMLFSESRSQVS